MARPRVARNNVLTARIDRLAADWISEQRREVPAGADWTGFCERSQSLFADIDSGVLWQNTAWNLFDVLGRPRLEDAHSRMIAWLMRPTEPHGLKDGFLRAFFEKALGKTAPAGTLECRVTVKKKIANGEVDIEVAGPRWRLIVENKIDCGEDQGQTKKYAAYYKQSAWESYFVFLSPEGKHPESRIFTPMSYGDLRDVLESVCESVRPATEVEQLVRHLVQNILFWDLAS